ncbi:hypothetical protein BDR03DRAFT_952830 [Suillus americanus]|nr:hypothetical protein BDR03DRAFT_952830 [Suillus americanus]
MCRQSQIQQRGRGKCTSLHRLLIIHLSMQHHHSCSCTAKWCRRLFRRISSSQESSFHSWTIQRMHAELWVSTKGLKYHQRRVSSVSTRADRVEVHQAQP